MQDFELRERADEDTVAPYYHQLYHEFPVTDYWDGAFLEFLRRFYSEGDRVLDLGCGPGSMWPYWQKLPGLTRLVGVDLSDGMIAEARRRHPGAEFHVGRALDLPFEAGSFDIVVASAVLHHLPETSLRPALDEIVRVLDEHGRVVGREPSSIHTFGKAPGWFSGTIMSFRHLVFRLTRSREYPEPALGSHHHVPNLESFLETISGLMHVTAVEHRFPFSGYVMRVRSRAVTNVVRHLDELLAGRGGILFHYAAEKNFVTADDLVRVTELARTGCATSMSDEEFLAYIRAASIEIEKLLRDRA